MQALYYDVLDQTVRALYPSLPIAMSILRGSPRPQAGDKQDTQAVCVAPLTAQEGVSPGCTVTACPTCKCADKPPKLRTQQQSLHLQIKLITSSCLKMSLQ